MVDSVAAAVLPAFGPGVSLRRMLAATACALLVAGPALAAEPPGAQGESPGLQGKGFTLYAGYQFGGSFTDETTGDSVDLREIGRASCRERVYSSV